MSDLLEAFEQTVRDLGAVDRAAFTTTFVGALSRLLELKQRGYLEWAQALEVAANVIQRQIDDPTRHAAPGRG